MEQLRLAVAAAAADNSVDGQQLQELQRILDSAAPAATPVCTRTTHLPALPPPDSKTVSLPPSFRLQSGVKYLARTKIAAACRDGRLSLQRLAQAGLSVPEFYNLNFSLGDLQPITLAFLQAPAVRLGDLARHYGLSSSVLLAGCTGFRLEELADTANTTADFRACGFRADTLLRFGENDPVAVEWLPRIGSVADWKVDLGLTVDHLIRLRFHRNLCGSPGWSYGELRTAYSLNDAQCRRLGVSLQL
jgi:hypothetical protein